MTKQELTQEIEKEFAQGNFKPSQLKRSKSLGNISVTPLPTPLKRTISQPEPLKQPNLTKQIQQLKEKLTFSQQTAQNYLVSLQTATAELDNKEQQLEQVNADWLELAQKSVAFLKEWSEKQTKIKQLSIELEQTIIDASQEINSNYQENTKLRNKLSQAQQQINTLNSKLKLTNSDLNLHQRAAELRINEPKPTYTWKDYAPIILLAVVYLLAAWLVRRKHYD